jgi:putative ABC transport system permease protein
VILLVACVNVANLMLARAAARQKEMAVRAALGAGRSRIVAQLMTESVLLGMAGGVLGLLLGWATLGVMKSMMPADTPRLAEISMDGQVLAYSILLSFVVGLVFGTVPAVQASRPDIEQVLRANAQTSGAGSGRSRASSALVVAEVAMAVILVSGAGLLIKSLWRLNRMDTGVQREDQVLIANMTPSWTYYQKDDHCVSFYRQVLENVRGLPGVESAALADTFPLENFFGMTLTAKDRPESITTPYTSWEYTVSPGYLKTMGIPLLRGRDFTAADRKNAPPVVMISRKLAQHLWPGEDPIGKSLRPAVVNEWSTVVGVVEDVQHYSSSPVTFNSAAQGDVYFPSARGITILPYYLSIVVRSQGDIPGLQRQIIGAVSRVNPNVPLSKWRTMRQIVSDAVARPRSTTWMFVVCASLALLLGLIGIYSVISYTVTYRTREIGVRIALGADRAHILGMMVRNGATLTVTGLALGTACGLALTRVMSSLLYDVSASDPMIYAMVALFVAVAALLATFIPSLRATRVDPTVALRCE